MQNTQSNTSLPAIAGNGFDDTDISNRVVQGTIVKFLDGRWTDRSGLPLPAQLIVLGITSCVQRWEDRKPAETIRKEPGKPLPSVEALNAKIPEDEWEIGPSGEPRPPWQLQRVVYLIDPISAATYTFISATVGARIAVERLSEQTRMMRTLRGASVVPLVKLDSAPMKTRFTANKQRPAFTVVEWRYLGGGNGGAPAIEHKPTPVEPVTLAEELDDAIPNWVTEENPPF
jgi:hypothetical protein